jgi:glutathione S-transferase
MITLHHLNNSRSQRILWLLEELGLSYEIIRYERDQKTLLAPPELRKIHPLGKSPIITDNDHVLAESGAIIEYLIDQYGQGRLRPKNYNDRLKYSFWLHHAEGSLMSPLLLSLIFNKIENSPLPFWVRPIAKKISQRVKQAFIHPNIKTHFDYLESALEKSRWFAGEEFSAADIQLSFPIEAAQSRGLLKERPLLQAYLKSIHARPAYIKALERGGAYSILN